MTLVGVEEVSSGSLVESSSEARATQAGIIQTAAHSMVDGMTSMLDRLETTSGTRRVFDAIDVGVKFWLFESNTECGNVEGLLCVPAPELLEEH